MIHSKILFLICKYNCMYWVSVLCSNIIFPLPPCPPPQESLSNRLVLAIASESTEEKREPWIITENMAATSSLSSELLAAIQVPNL